jgi:uncharacterized membrane protein
MPHALPKDNARLDSVDLLRGLVMVVMALDHVRDFFHAPAIHGVEPLDLTQTSPWIFLTRFVTHYCAPTFMFLAGTGAFLSVMRGKPKSELSWFLVTRGLWLIFLELTLLTWFGWMFAINLHSYFLATLWALGWAMIVLAGLIHLPAGAIITFGLVLVAGHNALDGVKPEAWGALAPVWMVLHAGGVFTLPGEIQILAFYPLIPWVGVMGLGYAFGTIYRWEPAARQRFLFRLGTAMIAGFVLLRWSNLYGNPTPWSGQRNAMFTFLSFLNVQKYPPSLLYLLVTLGPGMILLALFERRPAGWLKPLLVYGRVPMFYYVLHIPIIHGLSLLLNRVRFGGGDYNAIVGGNAPADAGVSLVWVYVIWLAVVIGLYPACRCFADLKRRRRDLAWLSYL